MKRSLVVWPLLASLIMIATGWIALNYELVQVRWLVAVTSRGAANVTESSENDTPSNQEESADAELASIRAWSESPLEIPSPLVVGLPAPSLDAQSDLFGFPIRAGSSDQLKAGLVQDDTQRLLSRLPVIASGVTKSALPDEDIQELFFAGPEVSETNPTDSRLVAGVRPASETATIVPPPFATPDAIAADAVDLDRIVPADVAIDSVPMMDRFDSGTMPQFPAERIAARKSDVAIKNIGTPDRMMHSPSAADLNPNSSASHALILEESPLQSDSYVDNELDRSPNVPSQNRFEGESDDELAIRRQLSVPRSIAWPVTHRLIDQLDQLQTVANRYRFESGQTNAKVVSARNNSPSPEEMVRWARDVRSTLDQLPNANRLGDPKVKALLASLKSSQQFAAQYADSVRRPEQRVAWLQAAYAVQRRLAVWQPIYRINSGEFVSSQHVTDDVTPVFDSIDQLRASLAATGDAGGWVTFLLLDDLQREFESGDDQTRREITQRFLSRLTWPNLDPRHRRWLESKKPQALARAIHPWASGAIDYASLIHQIEKAESNAIDLVTAEIAQTMQALRYAQHPEAKQLSRNLDAHYRNANVRVSISDDMIRELLPEVPSRRLPVRTTMFGSRVTGMSEIESQLAITLQPSPNRWTMTLETIGHVATRAIGRRGPAAVSTSSSNPFNVSTPITVLPTDLYVGKTQVDVGGKGLLRGINTTYDEWPLIGSLVRKFAESEYLKKASISDRIARNRIRKEVGVEVDRTINEKVNESTERFSQSVLGPLTRLKLEPKVIEMKTTTNRLVARYRMAGDWQLAAMTPRPRALANSLVSVQVHQSAINNTLEQLVPQDEVLPLDQVLRKCLNVIGMEQRELPSDLPDDVSIQFAKHRPITIEIEDGKFWVTMRIIRLERAKGMRLRNFIVRASYVPKLNGLQAELVRDGHLSISGPGMSIRQRLPVRAIFNKVLSPDRGLPITSTELLTQRVPENTVVSQMVLRDGWVGISLGPATQPGTVASRQNDDSVKR